MPTIPSPQPRRGETAASRCAPWRAHVQTAHSLHLSQARLSVWGLTATGRRAATHPLRLR